MGLLKVLKEVFSDLDNNEPVEKPITKKNIDKYKVGIQTLRRHPNYYKVKYLLMDCVICNIDCLPSTRELEQIIGIGRSSIARQLLILAQEGLIQRVKLSDSNRGIYYKIIIDQDEAILYRDTFTRLGRKKIKNIKSMSQ
jgi:DNA-binding MarR family transcriptional regulator